MVRRLFGLLVPFLGSAVALYLATQIFDQARFDNVVSLSVDPGDKEALAQTIATVTVIFGVVNTLVKPVVRFVTTIARWLSFGLLSLVINGGLLLLVGQVADRLDLPFHVALTPWVIAAAAFIGIVSSIVGWLGHRISRRKVVVKEKVVERVVERPAPQVPQYQPPAPPRPAPQYSAPSAPAPQYSPPSAPQYPPAPAQPQYPPAQPQYPPAQPQYPPAQPQYPPAQPQYPPAAPQYPPPPGPYGPGQGQTPGYGGQTYGSGQ